jgi:hypothetical protein
MSVSETIRGCCDAVRPVYLQVRQLRQDWRDLQTIEQAKAEYELSVAAEAGQLRIMKEKRNELEQQRQTLEEDPFRPTQAISQTSTRTGSQAPWEPPIPRPAPHPPHCPSRAEHRRARTRLKMLVNRWVHFWELDNSIQAEINQIADDEDRPLGEALSLLDWSLFEDPAYAHETSEKHLKRLNEWGELLNEYHTRLAAEMETLRTRFRNWLPIWERWRECRQHQKCAQNPDDAARWNVLIDETRRSLRREIDCLRQEIAELEQQIARLSSSRAAGQRARGMP